MRELVEFLVILRDLTGSHEAAVQRVLGMQRQGVEALSEAGLRSDVRAVAEKRAHDLGIVAESGEPVPVRIGELLLVADIMGAVPRAPAPKPALAPLVFTVPQEVSHLVEARARLDLLVADVIRDAEATLHIGGPFWNAEGLELLRPVLEPALLTRGVRCVFFVHDLSRENETTLPRFLGELGCPDQIKTWWYCGARGSLMHAKFIVADRRCGYFGSANLTSLGLAQHVEVGVGLERSQAEELLAFLESLVDAGLFRSHAQQT